MCTIFFVAVDSTYIHIFKPFFNFSENRPLANHSPAPLLLAQEDHLLAQEEDLILVHEEDQDLLAQEEDILLVQAQE